MSGTEIILARCGALSFLLSLRVEQNNPQKIGGGALKKRTHLDTSVSLMFGGFKGRQDENRCAILEVQSWRRCFSLRGVESKNVFKLQSGLPTLSQLPFA